MRVPVIVGTAALLALAALPAQAAIGPPEGEINLSVTDASGGRARGALLTCPSGLGNHPHGEDACRDLSTADGDLDRLPGDPGPCTKQYDPVTATAAGTWYGKPVEWTKTFGNACTLEAATGPVFRFWS